MIAQSVPEVPRALPTAAKMSLEDTRIAGHGTPRHWDTTGRKKERSRTPAASWTCSKAAGPSLLEAHLDAQHSQRGVGERQVTWAVSIQGAGKVLEPEMGGRVCVPPRPHALARPAHPWGLSPATGPTQSSSRSRGYTLQLRGVFQKPLNVDVSELVLQDRRPERL